MRPLQPAATIIHLARPLSGPTPTLTVLKPSTRPTSPLLLRLFCRCLVHQGSHIIGPQAQGGQLSVQFTHPFKLLQRLCLVVWCRGAGWEG